MTYPCVASLRVLFVCVLALSFVACVSSREPDGDCAEGAECNELKSQSVDDGENALAFAATMSAGPRWTCAIQEDHKVDCWGATVGLDETQPDEEFQQIATGSGVAHVACGVKFDGALACWGGNNSNAPKLAMSKSKFIQVVIGGDIACGLTDKRRAECTNLYGITDLTPPESEFVQLAAGALHVCGLHPDGTAECWGSPPSDDESRFNYGQTTPPSDKFVQLSAGLLHTCGLRTDGTVACWGFGRRETEAGNDCGQALPPAGVKMSWIAAGDYHTCGVRADDGRAVCWGAGEDGATGVNDFGQSAAPKAARFLTLTAGREHTCGLTTEHEIDCWGHDDQHQCAAPEGTFPSAITPD